MSMPGSPSAPCTQIRVATAQSAPIADRTASRVSIQNRPRAATLPP